MGLCNLRLRYDSHATLRYGYGINVNYYNYTLIPLLPRRPAVSPDTEVSTHVGQFKNSSIE